MNKNKILIITHSLDNESVSGVTRFIEETGGQVIRLNVDKYPVHSGLSTINNGDGWQTILKQDGKEYLLQDVNACWFRRAHHLGKDLPETIDKELLGATMGEVRQTLFGMLEGLPCFQLSRPSHYRKLDSKELQLKAALDCGLKIPPTCISNDPAQIEKFVRSLPTNAIAKMQSAFAVYQQGEEHVVFTNKVGIDDLEEIASAQLCPMIYQQEIEKRLELRVTVVGEKLFTFSIDSQQRDSSKTDWRREGVSLIKEWQPFELPENIQQSIRQFMRKLELMYGAIDLILTPEGEFYFLEVNAAGEFFWLDRLCDHAISREIASLLVNTGNPV